MKKQLSKSVFRPSGTPRACIEIVHGMSEHRKRYDGFAKYLQSRGYAVITYDLPGHGEDTDKADLGYFGEEGGWQNLIDSAVEINRECHNEFPGVPVIAFGHSMGTIILRCFIQKHEDLVDGVVLSGVPCYQSAVKAGAVLGKVIRTLKGAKGHSRMMDSMVTGGFNKSVSNPRTPNDWLSYNTENVDRYTADALCGFPFTVQGYMDLFTGTALMHEVKEYRCTKPELPIYMFAGQDDPCRGKDEGFQDSMNTLKSAGYKNIQSKIYPHMRHEVLNEIGHEQVFADTADWIDNTVQKISAKAHNE